MQQYFDRRDNAVGRRVPYVMTLRMTPSLLTTQMASCGEVDHSVGMLPSGRKVSGEACQGSGSPSPALPVPECAICLQSCVHPVRLPCSHIFCFLCVKGASWQSKRCALCRQEIPEDFLERPTLLSPEELKAAGAGRGPGEHAWYYEGRNGWWQYDERTSRELEDAFAKGKRSTEMLIAGFLYVADLENMVQYRRNEHGRRRRMKRDVADIPKKGVAGLRLDTEAAAAASIGAQGGAGRESSADGADTTISHPAGRGQGRNGEDEEEGEATPSRASSAPNTSVDESESGSSSLDEEEAEGEEEEDDEEEIEEEDAIEEEEEIQAEGTQVRQRLLPRERMRFSEGRLDRSPPGGKSSSGSSSSSSVRSRRPDGQCTVTEV
ncbi:hypothetical protein SKAU_G00216510 [Synaphobranchus kaupii]|uniref:E3 ubiquitin-protein ligase n=1 Tax=Synaphobranchus kaupii TaxID=118154 RepID=A0A9Q1F9U3_SYNKA|nr:hypothetical protein SKAU_G00216510 [Synaphobranchus kaupii]